MKETDHRMASLIRGRLETLARHPDERIRCLAYQVLLLDQPMPDYSRAFPSFIDSGLTFLNEDSIRAIAGARLGGQQLEALAARRKNRWRSC
jgi:hypothetical protein